MPAPNWQVFALRVGTLTVPARVLSSDEGEHPVEAPVIMWLLHQVGTGTNVLFDTGTPDPDTVRRHRPGLRYARGPSESPDQVLRAVGVDADEIQLVINSHLHWDHASNNHRFRRARILVQAAEWRAAADPPAGHDAAYAAAIQPPPWVQAESRTDLIDGAADVLPGLQIVQLPGHTPGSQGALVSTSRGRLLLAGDLVPLSRHTATTPPTLPGVVSSAQQATESLAAVAATGAYVLGSHDAEIFRDRRGPAVRVDDDTAHPTRSTVAGAADLELRTELG